MKTTRFLVTMLVLLGLLVPTLPAGALTPSPRPPAVATSLPLSREVGEGEGGRGVGVRAASRGNPWINLRDGEAVPTTYAGPVASVQALETAQPRALTSDDFDEDGMPDLVAGYAAGAGGLVALHLGSIDYLWPDGPEADARRAAGTFVDAPFLPEARLFALPIVPDYLAAGDFDNDGHRDVVAAARGGKALYLLSGDGHGGFGAPEAVPLPGAVTAFAAGEVNRRDGLQDLVVGIVGARHAVPLLVVFEGPTGALRWEPETIPLPAAATSIAIGQMDEHYTMDIAAACGETLFLVHGRDRQLSVLPPGSKAAEAVVTSHTLPYPISALALGDFIPEEGYVKELALLSADGTVHFLAPATAAEVASAALSLDTAAIQLPTSNLQLVTVNISSLPGDDLALLDPGNRQVHIVVAVERGSVQDENGVWETVVRPWSVILDTAGAPAALLPMRLNPDAFGDLVLLQSGARGPVVAATVPLATFVVNSVGDQHDSYLQDNMCDICHNPDADPPIPPCDICTLRAAVEQANHTTGADDIRFALGGGTPSIAIDDTVRIVSPVTVLGNTGGATRIQLTPGEAFDNDYGDAGVGIGAPNIVLRGFVFYGFCLGLYLNSFGGSFVEGNYIGPDPSGATVPTVDCSGNFYGGGMGIRMKSGYGYTIGGTTAQARNVISGHTGWGIYGGDSPVIGDSVIQGNYIGTDAGGTIDLGNGRNGIEGYFGDCTVGGTTAQARNVSSGNGRYGFAIWGYGNLVQGNYLGTDASGTMPLGNATAIDLRDAFGNTIGGPATGAANVMAYNGRMGLSMYTLYETFNNRVSRNVIYDNGELGIDLIGSGANPPGVGVNPNDHCDGDYGANYWQNYPVLLTTTLSGGQVTVEGYLDSTPDTTFTLEFFASNDCDPSGYGEGQFYLGEATVTTGPDCIGHFAVTLPARAKSLTATATDPSGNTSEFSACTLLPRYKTAEPARVTFRRPLTYTVGVKNTAAAPVAVNIQDPIPAGTAFVPGSLWASQGMPSFDGSRVIWDGTLDPGVALEVRFQVSTTCAATSVIHNLTTVNQDGTPYTVEAETERYDPEYLDIGATDPAPAAGAKDILIDPPPTLAWSGAGQCGTDPAAGDQVAYRVYVKSPSGNWQEVGAYPNCGRSVALPAGALQCLPNGDPAPYWWKVEAVDLQNPCRDPVVQAWQFTTASCRPAVVVKPQFAKYFLSGLEVENLYRAEVDWNGPARQGNGEALKGEVRFNLNGVEVVEPGQDWGAAHTYNMGQDFRASLLGGLNVLRIRAANAEGYVSEIAALQPQVFPIPAWITELPMGPFEIDLESMTVKYSRELEYPDPHFEARYKVPGWIPYMGGANMGIIETFAAVEAEACSDGSGAVGVSGNTGVQLTENAQVTGKLYGKGEVQLGAPAGLDLVGAELGLSIAGRIAKEMGVVDLIPAVKAAEEWPLVGWLVKWFNNRAKVKGALEPGIDVVTRFKDVNDELVFETMTGTAKIDLQLTLTLEVFEWLKAAVFGRGGPRVVVQVPPADPWGYLNKIGINLAAGLRLTVWEFEGEWVRGITCSLPDGVCEGDDEGLLGAGPPRLRARGAGEVGRFVGNSDALAGAEQEVPLVEGVFPLAGPALALRGDGRRMVLWAHDDTTLPPGQGMEIRAAYYNGASWAPLAVTDDTYPDFSPQVAFDAQGDAVAVWERSNTVWISPTLTITYARSFEIATAEWREGSGWSAAATLTGDAYADVMPELARGQDGTVLALWRTGDGVDLLGQAGHPLTLTYALWDGAGWTMPTAALAGLTGTLEVDLAVYSATRAALVLALDMDGDVTTGADVELAYATWDGNGWSGLTLLTSDAITDSSPALAYDPAGQPLLVWRQGDVLVQQVGWSGTPTAVRAGSASGAFLDFDLASAPNGNVALLWQAWTAEGADTAYAVYDAARGVWGDDLFLTHDDAVEEALSPAFSADGTLALAYQKVALEYVTLTVPILPTLTVTVENYPQPVRTDLYYREHALGQDLAAGAVEVYPPNPAPGTSALITATIHNAGDLAIAGGEVAFYDGDPQGGGTRIGVTQTLPAVFRAGTSATVSVGWAVPAGDAPHTLYVVADPAGALAERDETNNVATLGTVQPDLVVAWAHSSYDTATVTLTAVVENAGVTSAGPFAVAFRAGDPYTGMLLGTVTVTTTLPAGASVTVTLALTEPAGLAGQVYRFWAVADAGGTVAEADETNNAGYGALDILPDLALDAYDIAGEGSIVVTVHNSGVVTASDVVLMVWQGSFSGTVVYSGTVGVIPPGGSAAATFALPAGAYELWALADPHHAIPESDEGNNLAIRERATWNRVYLPLVQR